MLRLTLVAVIVTMLAAGEASGNPAKQSAWRGHIHKAKEFLLGNQGIPSALHKALAGHGCRGCDLGDRHSLLPALAIACRTLRRKGAVILRYSKLPKRHRKRATLSHPSRGKLTTLLHAPKMKLYDVLLKLHAMKTYDPQLCRYGSLMVRQSLKKCLQAQRDRGWCALGRGKDRAGSTDRTNRRARAT